MKFHSAIFYSKDLTPLKPFYIDFLGLTIDREAPDKFLSLKFSDSTRLGIKVGDKAREIGGHGTIFVEVKNIENWYQKAIDANVEIYKELTIQPWATSFSVLDPDGNKIEFIKSENE